MKNSELADIIHYYFRRLTKQAGLMQKDFNEDALHLFRVDVKKLRALLRMIRAVTEEPHLLKFPRRFKKTYAIIGKIRDRQLCLKRINENKKDENGKFSNKVRSLEKEMNELREKGNDFLTKKDFEEIEQSIIKQLSIVWEDTIVKNFFQQKLHVINEVVSKGGYSDKELHDIRKSIKDIIYIVRIYRDDLKTPLPFPFWNEAELKKAENFSHTLGLFNDACIALSLLLPADIKKTDTAEKEHLLTVRRKWLGEKRGLKKEMLNDLRAIRWELAISDYL